MAAAAPPRATTTAVTTTAPPTTSGDDDSGDEGADSADKDQPPVTAGGLYTKQTFPISQIERPLTLIKG